MAALAKTIGALLALLGVVVLLAGIAVGGYAFFDYGQSQRDVVRDQDREEADMAMMTGGAIVAALGLVLFLAGLVTLVASRPRPASPDATGMGADRRLRRTAGGPADDMMPGSTARAGSGTARPRQPLSLGAYAASPRVAVTGAVVGIVAVLVLVAALVLVQSGGDAFRLNGSPEPPPVLLDELHNGTVQGGAIGAGVPAFNFGENDGSFTIPSGAAACRLTLDWDPSAPGGAETLRLEVERMGAPVSAEEGGPGFTMDLSGPSPGVHGFAVFPATEGSVVSQDFSLRVVCLGA